MPQNWFMASFSRSVSPREGDGGWSGLGTIHGQSRQRESPVNGKYSSYRSEALTPLSSWTRLLLQHPADWRIHFHGLFGEGGWQKKRRGKDQDSLSVPCM